MVEFNNKKRLYENEDNIKTMHMNVNNGQVTMSSSQVMKDNVTHSNVPNPHKSIRFNNKTGGLFANGVQIVNSKGATELIIEGNFSCHNLDCVSITINGDVIGDIDCTNITVTGKVTGDIDGTNVTCEDVNGDIDAMNVSRR